MPIHRSYKHSQESDLRIRSLVQWAAREKRMYPVLAYDLENRIIIYNLRAKLLEKP